VAKLVSEVIGIESKKMGFNIMRTVILYLLIFLSLFANAQSSNSLDNVNVSFEISSKVAKDSSDLTFKVVFNNTSRRTEFVYNTLVDGGPDDEDANMYLDIEKFDDLNYKYYTLRFYHKMSEIKTDSICRDVPKRELHSLSTDTLSYNLLMIGKHFEPGKYRFKIHVRRSCKIFLPKGDGDTWYSEIDYIASKWLYFQVKNAISGSISSE
jgi:hypothetical protein